MKPILFNTPMTQVIASNRKSATRRIVKPQPNDTFDRHWETFAAEDGEIIVLKAPYKIGDILYVRERFCIGRIEYYVEANGRMVPYVNQWNGGKDYISCAYCLDHNVCVDGVAWKPSIHMPKDAARLFLRVTDVRVERLQEMTVRDLVAEGFASPADIPYSASERFDEFKTLWNGTIKPTDLNLYSWDANPWVWVIEFECCEKPEESTRRETN